VTAPWWEQPALGFDTESTGLNELTDRIVTIAMVALGGGKPSCESYTVNPGVPIPEAATAIHGITTEQAQRDGIAPPDALDATAGALALSLSKGLPVIAMNGVYDFSLLHCECVRHGVETVSSRLGGHDRLLPVVDPLVLDKHVAKFRSGGRKLPDLRGTASRRARLRVRRAGCCNGRRRNRKAVPGCWRSQLGRAARRASCVEGGAEHRLPGVQAAPDRRQGLQGRYGLAAVRQGPERGCVMTFLWIGMAMVGLFLAFVGWLVVLGLLERRDSRREAEQDDGSAVPFLRSQFEPYVPPHQPHAGWSEAKHRRDRDIDIDPAS
jgi:hypothetical protein